MRRYPAKLVKVVDGDTVDLVVDVGFYLWITVRVRLLGIDTPERGKPGAVEATAFVEAWMADVAGGGAKWPLIVSTEKGDSFGRWLARVYSYDELRLLNDDLVTMGHAVPYRS